MAACARAACHSGVWFDMQAADIFGRKCDTSTVLLIVDGWICATDVLAVALTTLPPQAATSLLHYTVCGIKPVPALWCNYKVHLHFGFAYGVWAPPVLVVPYTVPQILKICTCTMANTEQCQ